MSYVLHIYKSYHGIPYSDSNHYTTFKTAQETLVDIANDFLKNAKEPIVTLDINNDRYVCSSIEGQLYFKGFIEEIPD